MKYVYKGKIKSYSKRPPSEYLDPRNQKTRLASHPCTEKAKKANRGITFMEHMQKNSYGGLDKVLDVLNRDTCL